MRSEDLVKLRALGELCSQEFFNEKSLLVVAWRRILEVLELAMPEEKKVRGMKKKQQRKKTSPRKLEILDACLALGKACNWARDFDDAGRYVKRAKEGYEEQLGRDSVKALEATCFLITSTFMSRDERIENLRYLVKKMERALGEENVVTLETLNSLGAKLEQNGEFEEAKEVYERCLAGRMKVLGGKHKNTLGTLSNLGVAYWELRNNEKALEYYEGSERMLGKTHPRTLDTVMNIACVYDEGLEDYGKAEELYESALEGKEAQLGKDEESTIRSARNLRNCLVRSGNYERLAQLLAVYPKLKTN